MSTSDSRTRTEPVSDSGTPVRRPRLGLFREIALDRGIPADEAALEEIRSVYERYRGELETIRSGDLSIVPGGIEPMTALRWIERQGWSR